jgi:beta-hydroxylase
VHDYDARAVFLTPERFAFVPALEACFEAVLEELERLAPEEFEPSPDSLTAVERGYDETGWLAYGLHGEGSRPEHRARCPRTARACSRVPGMVNASFSWFRTGTHLYPHRGERAGLLRCHLGLRIPAGDVGFRGGGESRTWRPGRCLVVDGTIEHEARNHGVGDRVVLLVSLAAPSRAAGPDRPASG